MDSKDVKILLVDDEKKFLDTISEKIRLKGFEPLTASCGEEAIDIARNTSIDIAIVDQKMPGIDGLTTITKLKEKRPGLKTILLTGFGDNKIKQAAEALDTAYFQKDEMGDFWNFMKRLSPKSGMIIIGPQFWDKQGTGEGTPGILTASNPEELEMHAAWQAMERQRPDAMGGDHLYLASRDQKLIGETPGILDLKRNIRKVASLDCTVLILGETGTGKELIARAIHLLSPRNRQKFMAVNCGSFTEELLSNELFGHEKGAFTGALHAKRGVFEAASGGTILLDEIGDTPLSMQVKLLRVLEEKTITRVGGTDEVPTDVRILAATNQNLKKQVSQSQFREDLYYRLDTFVLRVPPLRERKEDIPLLCSYFLDKYRKEYGKEINRVSGEVLSVFMEYSFPGNVRELENAIERTVIMCEGKEIKKAHLPNRFRLAKPYSETSQANLPTLAELEKEHILRVLRSTKGNKSEAARVLGINRASLWRKLKDFDEAELQF